MKIARLISYAVIGASMYCLGKYHSTNQQPIQQPFQEPQQCVVENREQVLRRSIDTLVQSYLNNPSEVKQAFQEIEQAYHSKQNTNR